MHMLLFFLKFLSYINHIFTHIYEIKLLVPFNILK